MYKLYTGYTEKLDIQRKQWLDFRKQTKMPLSIHYLTQLSNSLAWPNRSNTKRDIFSVLQNPVTLICTIYSHCVHHWDVWAYNIVLCALQRRHFLQRNRAALVGRYRFLQVSLSCQWEELDVLVNKLTHVHAKCNVPRISLTINNRAYTDTLILLATHWLWWTLQKYWALIKM